MANGLRAPPKKLSEAFVVRMARTPVVCPPRTGFFSGVASDPTIVPSLAPPAAFLAAVPPAPAIRWQIIIPPGLRRVSTLPGKAKTAPPMPYSF